SRFSFGSCARRSARRDSNFVPTEVHRAALYGLSMLCCAFFARRFSAYHPNQQIMRTRISVFLITLSGLILEVGLTRIYSASIWYHFAFVAISVALLGWGLGGFTVHLLKRVKPMSMNAAALVTLLYAGAIPLCLWLLVRYPFDMDRLPMYFLAPLLPFFLAGMALSIIFDLHR